MIAFDMHFTLIRCVYMLKLHHEKRELNCVYLEVIRL